MGTAGVHHSLAGRFPLGSQRLSAAGGESSFVVPLSLSEPKEDAHELTKPPSDGRHDSLLCHILLPRHLGRLFKRAMECRRVLATTTAGVRLCRGVRLADCEAECRVVILGGRQRLGRRSIDFIVLTRVAFHIYY